jgi:hypothetical protein
MRSGPTVLAALLLSACARPETPPRCAWNAPAAEPSVTYRYRASAGPGAAELCVEVDVPRAPQNTWGLEAPLERFVRDVALANDGAALPAREGSGGWIVPACTAAGGCRLRYRVLLADAAHALDDHDLARVYRGAILAPPSSWLLRPMGTRGPFLLAVDPPKDQGFVTGLALAAPGSAWKSAFAGDVGRLDDTPYAAFGAFSVASRSLPGGVLDVAIGRGDLDPAGRAAVYAWIDRSAAAVSTYYGRFPIAHAALVVLLDESAEVGGGHTMGNGGGAVIVTIGEHIPARELADDWVLIHEMVHLSFPDVGRPWAEEGLATYVEPIMRRRSGMIDRDEVWHQLVEGLPKGQPEADDRGLDVTDTWGRRYWGGAMYWLLADVEIRKRTGNRRSLDDALRAINRAGGDVSVHWELDEALRRGDEGTGVDVLRPLRASMGGAPVTVDLDALWKSLGVSLRGGKVTYDDAAPLASIREGITAAAPGH